MGRGPGGPEGQVQAPDGGTMSDVQRIGVDAVSVDRIGLAVRRSGPGLPNKVYTPAELVYCNGDDERLAGRWAAKEAVIKCFDGTGICFPRRRIEVLPGPNGAPRARLLGNHRGAQLEVSITHHSRLAVATAHLEIPDAAPPMLPAPHPPLIPTPPKDPHNGTLRTPLARGGRRLLAAPPGALARLTGKTAGAINAGRPAGARRAAREWGAVVVLKGAHTVVAPADGRISEDPHEVPALASGGTGDVLSGIIGGLMAQGSEPLTAALTGVSIHAAAGRPIAEAI